MVDLIKRYTFENYSDLRLSLLQDKQGVALRNRSFFRQKLEGHKIILKYLIRMRRYLE